MSIRQHKLQQGCHGNLFLIDRIGFVPLSITMLSEQTAKALKYKTQFISILVPNVIEDYKTKHHTFRQ